MGSLPHGDSGVCTSILWGLRGPSIQQEEGGGEREREVEREIEEEEKES